VPLDTIIDAHSDHPYFPHHDRDRASLRTTPTPFLRRDSGELREGCRSHGIIQAALTSTRLAKTQTPPS
jgi:hypothetical protein